MGASPDDSVNITLPQEKGGTPVIAIFHADIRTQAPESHVYYRYVHLSLDNKLSSFNFYADIGQWNFGQKRKSRY